MTRIHVFERDGWRRPAIAQANETYDETSLGLGRRAVEWTFHDQNQLDDLARLAKGELCSECLEPMPARPSPATVSEFRRVYQDKPDPVKSRWAERVLRGACPICGTEVSTEYFEALHRGVIPKIHYDEAD